MKKRFSSQELFEIRNTIPVDMLIKDQLQMPSKIRDGIFRFLCPICNEFQTGVNPATNLARCFRCEQNFNTIDLVMKVKKWGFKESVLFLKTLFKKIPNHDVENALKDLCTDPGRPVLKGFKSYTKASCDMGKAHEFNVAVSGSIPDHRSLFQNQSISQSSQVSACDLQVKKRVKTRNPETVRQIFQKMFLDGQNNS